MVECNAGLQTSNFFSSSNLKEREMKIQLGVLYRSLNTGNFFIPMIADTNVKVKDGWRWCRICVYRSDASFLWFDVNNDWTFPRHWDVIEA